MSRAAQQRVIEEHQATIKDLKVKLAQAESEQRARLDVYSRLTDVCDDHVVAGLEAVPITVLRTLRPRGHGI